jgi:hypothetical protein
MLAKYFASFGASFVEGWLEMNGCRCNRKFELNLAAFGFGFRVSERKRKKWQPSLEDVTATKVQ